ncbi:hypothetical protein BJF96_g7160 [Verticillium dahliae]|uniref:Uncharacterized protein n=1 Tax=Verticillium dahliae TaxID=27337 RepID=A0AA45AJW6_VERDA|nr:hypothetical protein BJF96_g7160 [Verticillium dahliae]PNH52576.1 hypothetical protein VD0003_g4742 [Verticillium dahliae]
MVLAACCLSDCGILDERSDTFQIPFFFLLELALRRGRRRPYPAQGIPI